MEILCILFTALQTLDQHDGKPAHMYSVSVLTDGVPAIHAVSCGYLFHGECKKTWKNLGHHDCPFCGQLNITFRPMLLNYVQGDLIGFQNAWENLRGELRTAKEKESNIQAEVAQWRTRNDGLQEQYDFHIMTLQHEEEDLRREKLHLHEEIDRLRWQTPRELDGQSSFGRDPKTTPRPTCRVKN